MGDDTVANELDYEWAEAWEGTGVCVAWVAGADPETVLGQMVADPPTDVLSAAEARAWAADQTTPDYATAIEATGMAGWALTVETNGYQATRPEVAELLSAGTRVVVVFRNVNAVMSFMYAVDGVMVRSFDPLLYNNSNPWGGETLAEESGLDFGYPIAAAFACAERLTGLRLTEEMLGEPDGWIGLGHHPSFSRPKCRSRQGGRQCCGPGQDRP